MIPFRVNDESVSMEVKNESVGMSVQDVSVIKTGGVSAKIGTVTLFASKWVKVEDNLYSQVVSIEGVTENSQVDLTPDVEQLMIFYKKDLSFVTENEDGVVTVFAIGQKLKNDYTMQVTITEVVA